MKQLFIVFFIWLIGFNPSASAADGLIIQAGLSEIASKDRHSDVLISFALSGKKHIGTTDKEGFGQKTAFVFSGTGFELKGKIKEPEPHKIEDEFVGTMWVHEGEVVFRQPIQVTDPSDFSLTIQITGQVCDDMSCIPFDEVLTVGPRSLFSELPKQSSASSEILDPFLPFSHSESKEKTSENPEKPQASDSKVEGNYQESAPPQSASLWSMFWAGLVGGLLALVTPCVFPMIPITISYFLKQSDDDRLKALRLATVYSVGIVVIFTGLGLALTKFLGAAGANWLAVNPWVNLFIGLVFTLFAFSFLGAFELRPPAWLMNASSSSRQSGGYLGALIMGLTFAVTSFTCTAPIVGSQLALAAQTGEFSAPTVTMLGFSGIIAVVFFSLSLFPSLMKSLPKSGGWLGAVKVVLGFVELALALKFFRVVDVRWGWDFLSHDMVLAMWVILGLITTLYLAGLLKMKHDSPVEGLGVMRLLVTFAFGVFSIYLMTGLSGSSLSGNIEAFLGVDPPGYRGWKINHVNSPQKQAVKVIWYEDYDEALKVAQKLNKPVFVDYSGNACVNCIKMEKGVFPHLEEVFESFVCVHLLTDLDTDISRRWQKMQIDKYQDSSLPFYVIETPEGRLLNKTSGMHSVEEFRRFLEEGLRLFSS